MGTKIEVIDIQKYIDAVELIDPSLQAAWEKQKEKVLQQTFISIEKGELTKKQLLSLSEPCSYACGCLGPRDGNVLCGCSLVRTRYYYRYHIYQELEKLGR